MRMDDGRSLERHEADDRMTTMRLTRTACRPDGILGVLYDAEGTQLAVTLEHSYGGVPKLPAGTYRCQRGPHRLHGMMTDFETFEVMGVPGHTGILFHWGNYHGDSDGCILLGRVSCGSPKGCMVTSSRATFARWMHDREGVPSFFLTVE